MESLKHCLSQTKKIGTQRREKQNIHETLKHAAMAALSKKYKLQGKLCISLNLGKNTSIKKTGDKWWLPNTRKSKKTECVMSLRRK